MQSELVDASWIQLASASRAEERRDLDCSHLLLLHKSARALHSLVHQRGRDGAHRPLLGPSDESTGKSRAGGAVRRGSSPAPKASCSRWTWTFRPVTSRRSRRRRARSCRRGTRRRVPLPGEGDRPGSRRREPRARDALHTLAGRSRRRSFEPREDGAASDRGWRGFGRRQGAGVALWLCSGHALPRRRLCA